MNVNDLKMADGTPFLEYLKNNAIDKELAIIDEWTKGYETCKSRLAKVLLPQINNKEK